MLASLFGRRHDGIVARHSASSMVNNSGDPVVLGRRREYDVIKLRLRRMGAKKRPFYRIVAAEHSSPRDGRFIEIVGHYDPLTNPATVVIKDDRIRHWISVGAQPTDTVAGLLKGKGVIGEDGKLAPVADVAA